MKRFIICISIFLSGSLAHAASFDCANASTNIEKLICWDPVLSSLDDRLAEAYRVQLSSTDTPEKTKADQRQWLSNLGRNCDNVECIRVEYLRRINVLHTDILRKNVAPAPSEEVLIKSEAQPDARNSDPIQVTPPQPVSLPTIDPVVPPVVAPSVDAIASQPVPEPPMVTVKQAPLSDTSKPPFAIADIFGLILTIFVPILVAAFIRPKWVLRWDSAPSRKKAALYLLPIGLLIGGLADFTKTDERLAYDTRLAKEKRFQEEQTSQQRNAQSGGIALYKSYKSMPGFEDRPNYNEDEYVNSALLSTCNVNGKPRGKYGWIEYRNVFVEGHRLKNEPVERMYIFAVGDPPNGSVAWRGGQYVSQLEEIMKQTCD